MANKILTISEAVQQARDSWKGEEGKARGIKISTLINTRLPEYANALGISMEEVWERWEKERNVNTTNWYQDFNYPKLDDSIIIVDSVEDFKKRFPSGKSICPNCKEITEGYGHCEHCHWSAGGLFGTLNSGVQVMIKETVSKPYWIFNPLELKNEIRN